MIQVPGLERLYALLLARLLHFDHMGKRVWIHPLCDLQPGVAPYVHIGDGVRIDRDVWINAPCTRPPRKGQPTVRIGAGVAIGRRCSISGAGGIEIGEDVIFGPGALVMDHGHGFARVDIPVKYQGITEPGRIIIEAGCWIGHNAAILASDGREIRLGRNTVVGANAVVTRSFPAGSVVIAPPARNVGLMSRSAGPHASASEHETEKAE